MKRYYLCDIIGNGTEDNPFRPAVADYGVSWVGNIPTDPVTGMPTTTWTMVMVNAQNHGQLISDSRIDALPDFPLDGKVSAIHTNTRNKMLADMGKRNIDASFVGSADGFRDVVRGIGKKLEATFDENNFDVM